MSADGNIVGNVYDKYGTTNPIARWLMRGFLDAVTELFDEVAPRRVLEVGCGEGRLAAELVASARRKPEQFIATDVSLHKIDQDLDPVLEFREASVYELPFADGAFDLVVCCEVLEHLEEPERALSEIARVTGGSVIVSTPREPLWRALNVARGKYVRDLGNTPGHIQHFSQQGLLELVTSRFFVERVKAPVPWTVLRGVPR